MTRNHCLFLLAARNSPLAKYGVDSISNAFGVIFKNDALIFFDAAQVKDDAISAAMAQLWPFVWVARRES